VTSWPLWQIINVNYGIVMKEFNISKNIKAEEILKKVFENFSDEEIALSSSLSYEDQVLTDMLYKLRIHFRVFMIDTGRHFQETYDVMQKTIEKYNIQYETVFPNAEDVENLLKEKGPNSFYESVENRKHCCYIRKVKPAQRIFTTLDAMITGLRREQSNLRNNLEAIEYDENTKIYKINPLYNWTSQMVIDYIKTNKVPYNILHDKGYFSIGCMPCTTPVKEGEDIRAGRWRWENATHKECGLHIK